MNYDTHVFNSKHEYYIANICYTVIINDVNDYKIYRIDASRLN